MNKWTVLFGIAVVAALYVGVVRTPEVWTEDSEKTLYVMTTPRAHLIQQDFSKLETTPAGNILIEGTFMESLPLFLGDGGASGILTAKLPQAVMTSGSPSEILRNFVNGMTKGGLDLKERKEIFYEGHPGWDLGFSGLAPFGPITTAIWGRMRIYLMGATMVITMIGGNVSTYNTDQKIIDMMDSFYLVDADEEGDAEG